MTIRETDLAFMCLAHQLIGRLESANADVTFETEWLDAIKAEITAPPLTSEVPAND